MKKSIVLILQLVFILSSLFSFYGGCVNRTPNSKNPPVGPMVPVSVSIPRPNEQNTPDALKNINFLTGPCREIFEPTTFSVSIGIYYMNGLGQPTQFGNIQHIYGVQIPQSGDIFLSNVSIPSGGEFWIEVFYKLDNCTQCCSKSYLNSNSINEGCDATIETNLIDQGKPVFKFRSHVITQGLNLSQPFPLEFENFYCYCNCL